MGRAPVARRVAEADPQRPIRRGRRARFRVEPLTDVLALERDDASREALSVVIRVSTDERRARSLASAHQKYQAASDASFNDHIVESTKLIQDVLAPLDEAHSPFAESARRLDAVGSYYANDLTGALTKATAVVAYAKAHRDSELRGLAYRLQGLVHVVQGEFASALDSNEAALKCFQVSGDLANEASIQSSLAENFQLSGRPTRHGRLASRRCHESEPCASATCDT